MPEQQRPSVGRIVHYVSHGSPVREDGTQAYRPECRAAIITEITEPHPHDELGPRVGLCVLNPTGQFFNRSVIYDFGLDPDPNSTQVPACDGLEYKGGTWHWPART